MRKVNSGLFITMDGVVEAPATWQESFDAEVGQAMMESMAGVDTILLGRGTYQDWEPDWTRDRDFGENAAFAAFINNTPKYVASKTLDKVQWGSFDNATLVNDVGAVLPELKAQDGGKIAVMGSPGLVNSLIQENLLDELTLIIHNVAAYGGKRLFREGQLKRFDLVSSKASSSGVIIATYQPRKP